MMQVLSSGEGHYDLHLHLSHCITYRAHQRALWNQFQQCLDP